MFFSVCLGDLAVEVLQKISTGRTRTLMQLVDSGRIKVDASLKFSKLILSEDSF